MEWYEASEDEIQRKPELLAARHAAYYKTFLTSPEGLAVLHDLHKEACIFNVEELEDSPEQGVKFLALSDFIAAIKRKCGVDDEMEVLRAWVPIAKGHEPPVQEKPSEQQRDLLT